jgi:hypothetical protein
VALCGPVMRQVARQCVPVAGIAVLVAACSSSSKTSSEASSASSKPPGSISRASSSPSAGLTSGASAAAADQAAIRDAYVTFFRGTTPAVRKVRLLQNGAAFAAVITAQATSPLAQSTAATVSAVTVQSTDRAVVVYTVTLAGQPALTNQTGVAVRESGSWKVAAVTFCALLTLEGRPPPACAKAASASPTG